jgi:hypothetical protein
MNQFIAKTTEGPTQHNCRLLFIPAEREVARIRDSNKNALCCETF